MIYLHARVSFDPIKIAYQAVNYDGEYLFDLEHIELGYYYRFNNDYYKITCEQMVGEWKGKGAHLCTPLLKLEGKELKQLKLKITALAWD